MLSPVRALRRPAPLRFLRLPLSAYLALARQRRALARLDDTRLADLGLSREDADIEARRPAWDVPQNWVRQL